MLYDCGGKRKLVGFSKDRDWMLLDKVDGCMFIGKVQIGRSWVSCRLDGYFYSGGNMVIKLRVEGSLEIVLEVWKTGMAGDYW